MVKIFAAGRTGESALGPAPDDEYGFLRPVLQFYFPVNAVLSAVTVMLNGDAIVVATVGNEGVSGLPALGAHVAASRVCTNVLDRARLEKQSCECYECVRGEYQRPLG